MIPKIVIGTNYWLHQKNKTSLDELCLFLKDCYEENYITFDLIDNYQKNDIEELFGNVIAKSEIKRNNLRISTKCGVIHSKNKKSYNTSKEYIIKSVNNSLTNLNTDYLDVLFLSGQDFLMDLEEIENTFTELKVSGKVKHFGVSNFSPYALGLLNNRVPIIGNQINLSLINPIKLLDETILKLMKHNKKLQVYSSTDDYYNKKEKLNQKLITTLLEFTEKYNASIDQIFLAWILKIPCKITPIVNSTDITKIRELSLAFNINLSSSDWYDLLEASTGKSL